MTSYRSHYCSDLSISNLNESVVLSGWVDTIRDHGNLLFIDLRDNFGITQCVVDAKKSIFTDVSFFKPQSSRSESKETYLHCKIFKSL